MDKQAHDAITKLIKGGYLAKDLEPLKCHKCESIDVRITVCQMDGGHVSEKAANCHDCKVKLGYWAYGGWEA